MHMTDKQRQEIANALGALTQCANVLILSPEEKKIFGDVLARHRGLLVREKEQRARDKAELKRLDQYHAKQKQIHIETTHSVSKLKTLDGAPPIQGGAPGSGKGS